MNEKKAYIIRGSVLENGDKKEWIECITISKKRADRIKSDLNNSLLEVIERGRSIFDKYLKDPENNLPWSEMEFHTEQMDEMEFIDFCSYRYGTKLPFKIEEINLS